MYEGDFDFRKLLPPNMQFASLLPTPVPTTREPPVPGVGPVSSIPMTPPAVLPPPTPVTTTPTPPVVTTPVFTPAAQPSEGPPPFAPVETVRRTPEMKTTGTDERNVPGKDPFYQRALAWANSQQGKEALANLSKGMGSGGGTGPVAPPFRASASGGASPDPTAHLKGQGKSLMDQVLEATSRQGKLGGDKKRRKASDRYNRWPSTSLRDLL